MRAITDNSGEKSFISFITHAGNGGIAIPVTDPGTAEIMCIQAQTEICHHTLILLLHYLAKTNRSVCNY